MKKNKKRYLKSIGTLSFMAIPAIAAISCSSQDTKKIERAAKTGADKAIKKYFPTPGKISGLNPAHSPIVIKPKPRPINTDGPSRKNFDTSESPQNLKDAYDYLNNQFESDFKQKIDDQKILLVMGSTNQIVQTILDKNVGWKQIISHKNDDFTYFLNKNVLRNSNAQNALFKWNKIKLTTSIDGSNILKFNFKMSGSVDINITIDLNIYS